MKTILGESAAYAKKNQLKFIELSDDEINKILKIKKQEQEVAMEVENRVGVGMLAR
jgi:hypothetical protein